MREFLAIEITDINAAIRLLVSAARWESNLKRIDSRAHSNRLIEAADGLTTRFCLNRNPADLVAAKLLIDGASMSSRMRQSNGYCEVLCEALLIVCLA